MDEGRSRDDDAECELQSIRNFDGFLITTMTANFLHACIDLTWWHVSVGDWETRCVQDDRNLNVRSDILKRIESFGKGPYCGVFRWDQSFIEFRRNVQSRSEKIFLRIWRLMSYEHDEKHPIRAETSDT